MSFDLDSSWSCFIYELVLELYSLHPTLLWDNQFVTFCLVLSDQPISFDVLCFPILNVLVCLVLSDQPISFFFSGTLTPFLIFYFHPGVRINIQTNCLQPMGCCGSVNHLLLPHYNFRHCRSTSFESPFFNPELSGSFDFDP